MTDTYWADISYYQRPVDDSYPHPVFAFRANDGTYRDTAFAANHSWAKAAADSGRLSCFIVYIVYRTNWQETLATLQSMVGTPHPKMAVMIDVESWGGQVTGDQSGPITALRDGIGAWLGSNARVCAYGGVGDLASLYPNRPADLRIVVASYGQVVTGYPGQFAQQYSDREPCAPFGTCDMNIARGMTPADVAGALGITGDDDMSQAQYDQLRADIGYTRDQIMGAVAGVPSAVLSQPINRADGGGQTNLYAVASWSDYHITATRKIVQDAAASVAQQVVAAGGVGDPAAVAAAVVAAVEVKLAALSVTLTASPPAAPVAAPVTQGV
jgi:hypothetical protein